MRAIVWGTYDTTKPRTRILLAALAATCSDVQEIHADVWREVTDKSQLKGLGPRLALLLRWLSAYPMLLARYAFAKRADVVVIGYLGQLDVLVVWPLAWLRGEKIAWDAFISLYDTVVDDRKMISPDGFLARALHTWEWLACRAADLVLLDTEAHAQFFRTAFSLPRGSHVQSFFVGAEASAFSQTTKPATLSDDEPVRMLFYGQFIALHGIGTIIEAARLTDARVQWVLIGRGQESARVQRMLDAHALANLTWIPWVDYRALQQHIARAHVCLGIFGASSKAARVIPNKVFQILSVGKALITRDSPAIRELLKPTDAGVYLVPAADPQALVDAIERYRVDAATLREPLHAAIVPAFSAAAIATQLQRALASLFHKESP